MSPAIYLIAGEHSGDFLGSKIIDELKSQRGDKIKFLGVGGALMGKSGMSKLFDLAEINLMGFFEILPHIFRLRRLIQQVVDDILLHQPDIVVTIDSPGFTLRVAKALKNNKNFRGKLLHLVAPSVWAYREGRAEIYAKTYDYLITLLPFEPPYFTKLGLKASAVGHPILEQDFCSNKQALREKYGFRKKDKVICVTCGSRVGEIKAHGAVFAEALKILREQIPDLKVIFPLAKVEHKKLIQEYLGACNLNSIATFTTERLEAYAAADFAIAKSGTNTLEISASKTPMLVCYRMNFLSYLAIKAMIKIKYVNLVNIVAKKEVIPELIQQDCNAKTIAREAALLINNKQACIEQVEASEEALKQMGFKAEDSASKKAAKIISSLLPY